MHSPVQYQIFIPMVNKVLVRHRINHQRYDVLICRIVKVSIRILWECFHVETDVAVVKGGFASSYS